MVHVPRLPRRRQQPIAILRQQQPIGDETIRRRSQSQVALLGNDGTAVLKPVQLGRDFGDSVEVVAGLSPSDRVIDSPPETLQNGDQVQLAQTTPSAKQAAAASATRAD